MPTTGVPHFACMGYRSMEPKTVHMLKSPCSYDTLKCVKFEIFLINAIEIIPVVSGKSALRFRSV